MSFLCFKSSLAAYRPLNLCFLELLRKWTIQLNILTALRCENFDNSLSNMFSVIANMVANSLFLFHIRFFAIFNFLFFRSLCLILEPFRTFPPFIIKLTYFTTTTPKNVFNRFYTLYVLYSLLSFNQCRTVVLPDHTYIFLHLVN